jgi:putative transcriptional regulator
MNNFPVIFAFLPSVVLFAQPLATGNLLVATRESRDPDFARSVVLLIHYDSESAIGLMLNKPTTVPISDVLPDAKGKSITVFAGGPITLGVRGLLRSKAPPFFTVISNRTDLLRLISRGLPPNAFRIYAGYTGWTAQQLQNEIARRLWKVLPPTPATVFYPHPETLWPGLRLVPHLRLVP